MSLNSMDYHNDIHVHHGRDQIQQYNQNVVMNVDLFLLFNLTVKLALQRQWKYLG